MSEYSSNFVIFFLKLPAHVSLWHLGHQIMKALRKNIPRGTPWCTALAKEPVDLNPSPRSKRNTWDPLVKLLKFSKDPFPPLQKRANNK